jgi:hypothetical protein
VVSSGTDNQAPVVTITSPADGSIVVGGVEILLSAAASDVEDDDLAASISWSSSKDGVLGSGGSISVLLSKGKHTITASVSDNGGQVGNDTVAVRISKK